MARKRGKHATPATTSRLQCSMESKLLRRYRAYAAARGLAVGAALAQAMIAQMRGFRFTLAGAEAADPGEEPPAALAG